MNKKPKAQFPNRNSFYSGNSCHIKTLWNQSGRYWVGVFPAGYYYRNFPQIKLGGWITVLT